jgi:hypothetical protein
MFAKQMRMLGYVPVVEIGYARIQQNIKEESEIEDIEIKSIILKSDRILHGAVNSEDPERLDKEVQKQR